MKVIIKWDELIDAGACATGLDDWCDYWDWDNDPRLVWPNVTFPDYTEVTQAGLLMSPVGEYWGWLVANGFVPVFPMPGWDLRGLCLDYLQYPDADFTGAKLRYSTMNQADLRGASFVGADLVAAEIKESICRYADFTGAKLIDAELWGTDLAGAKFVNADLAGADLEYADLTGADFTGALGLDTVDFYDAILTDVKGLNA